MDKKKIKEKLVTRSQFHVPVAQKAFNLTFPEIKEIVDELVRENKIEFVSGLLYRSVQKNGPALYSGEVYKPKTPMEETYIKALWECVKVGGASSCVIQRGCNVGFSVAM